MNTDEEKRMDIFGKGKKPSPVTPPMPHRKKKK